MAGVYGTHEKLVNAIVCCFRAPTCVSSSSGEVFCWRCRRGADMCTFCKEDGIKWKKLMSSTELQVPKVGNGRVGCVVFRVVPNVCRNQEKGEERKNNNNSRTPASS